MKKTTLVVLILVLISAVAVATTYTASIFGGKTTNQYTERMTIVSATTNTSGTAPGAGNIYNLPMPMSHFSCEKILSYTTPSTSTMLLEGSSDGGTTWVTLATSTTTTDDYFGASTYAVTSIRGNWSVITGPTGSFNNVTYCYGRQY